MSEDFVSSVWDFKQKTIQETNYITHDYLRWYGKLVPQLVNRLIRMYTTEEEKVLANFVGSGTVLLEGCLLNRKTIGCDTNPLARLLCRVKTRPYSKSDDFLEKCKNKLKRDKYQYSLGEFERKWYYKKNYEDMMAIKEEIDEIKNNKKREFYLLALASIVKKISKVDSRCVHHIVVDEDKKDLDVFKAFKNKVQKMKKSAKKLEELDADLNKIKIKDSDARKLDDFDNSSIDFIISHPPYLGAVNYSNIYKLENDLLGFDYEPMRKKDISTTSLNKYMKSMKKVFDSMHRVLKNKKFAAVIIGDTRKKGNIVPTSSHFIRYALKTGYQLKDVFIWVLNRKAGMNVKRHGNYIDHNYILIFQKKD